MRQSNRRVIAGLGIGAIVLGGSSPAMAFDTGVIDWAIGELCGHISGHLGGLLVTVAGFGAIVAAAMGSYRVFYGAIITAVGAFATSTIMSLYFPEAAAICNGGGGAGGGGTARSAETLSRKASTAKSVPSESNDPFDTLVDKY